MSVSFTQVQAAVQNLTPNGGASGPLTLNVLHKTDALLSKLLAFDQSKSVSVEVLKATPNGRAEVIAGGLKLDVKASLPLKAGEVLQLKLEPVGSTVRFVQGPPAEGAKSQAQIQTQVQGQGQNNTPGGVHAKLPGTTVAAQQTGKIAGGVTLASGTSGSGASGNGQQAQLTSGQLTATNLNSTASSATNSAKLSGQVVTNTTGGATGNQVSVTPQQTASALIKLVAETLPQGLNSGPQGLSSGQAGTGLNAGGLQSALQGSALASKQQVSGRRDELKNSDLKSTAKGGGSALQSSHHNSTIAQGGLTEKPSAEQVLAKYTQFTSVAIEEVQDIQGRQAQKADLTVELPINGFEKPLPIHLSIGPDDSQSNSDDERSAYALNFSLETEATGQIHAAVSIPRTASTDGVPFRVVIWAERPDFAALLEEQRSQLQDRFAATGLDLSALQIKRGHPLTAQFKALSHIDSEI